MSRTLLQKAGRGLRGRSRFPGFLLPQRHRRAIGTSPSVALAEKVVPLSPCALDANATDEITVYVKGFLAPNDSPSAFDDWREQHLRLVRKLGWGKSACGIIWNNGSLRDVTPFGSLASVPTIVPFPVTAAVQLLSRSRALSPAAFVASSVAETVGLSLIRLAYAFSRAEANAEADAAELARVVDALRGGANNLKEEGGDEPLCSSRRRRVRVVAHSLGCRHALEAAVGDVCDSLD